MLYAAIPVVSSYRDGYEAGAMAILMLRMIFFQIIIGLGDEQGFQDRINQFHKVGFEIGISRMLPKRKLLLINILF